MNLPYEGMHTKLRTLLGLKTIAKSQKSHPDLHSAIQTKIFTSCSKVRNDTSVELLARHP